MRALARVRQATASKHKQMLVHYRQAAVCCREQLTTTGW